MRKAKPLTFEAAIKAIFSAEPDKIALFLKRGKRRKRRIKKTSPRASSAAAKKDK